MCLCNVGYTRGSDGCVACAAGKYKDEVGGGECSSCPSAATSPAASTNQTDCTCNAGYTGDQCMPCAAGKYKDEAGGAECASCPLNSSSPAASDNITDCLCYAGYSHGEYLGMSNTSEANSSRPVCVPCPPGYYKSVNGSSPCVACAAGKYNEEAGATSESACFNCTEHSASGVASSSVAQCVCDKGYTRGHTGNGTAGNGTAGCVACARGSYKDVNGSAPCTLCTAGKFSETLAAMTETACLNCSTVSYSPPGSSNWTQCVCNRCGKIEEDVDIISYYMISCRVYIIRCILYIAIVPYHVISCYIPKPVERRFIQNVCSVKY